MRTISKIASPLAAIALSLGVGSAQAALVNFTLTGEVIYADAGNGFSLNSGDTVSVIGTFDDSVLTGGTGTVDFSAVPGNSFTVTAGSFTFTEADDITGGSYPNLELNAGAFVEFNFLANIGGFGFFDSQLGYFDGDDDNFGTMSGVWTDFTMTPVVVPVPAAVWLFGTGLLGLVGIARRRSVA
jgi:hypothetical protein